MLLMLISATGLLVWLFTSATVSRFRTTHAVAVANSIPEITTIITLCPRKSNPDTTIFSNMLQSIVDNLPHAAAGTLIVGFDGLSIKKHQTELHIKCKDPATSEKNYNSYKEAIKGVCEGMWPAKSKVHMVYQDNRVCLIQNLKKCVDQVTTDYVLILQDDQMFLRQVNLISLIALMKRHRLNSVIFDHFGSQIHKDWWNNFCGSPLPLLDGLHIEEDGFDLSYARSYSDSVQVARVDFYRDVVFPGIKDRYDFMEHLLGCDSLSTVNHRIVVENNRFTIHQDGRNYLGGGGVQME